MGIKMRRRGDPAREIGEIFFSNSLNFTFPDLQRYSKIFKLLETDVFFKILVYILFLEF